MSTFPSPEPQAPSPLRLPPSERDFEIYDAIHIDGSSTRYQAKQHEISQTRVRQIIRRVVEWLGEVLPPQTKVAKEQETHLARQIAADRFQRQFEQINELWKATLESKFASIRIRLTTAQARLGAVGGLIDGLAADAIEGLPVPIWTTTEAVGWDKAAAADGPPFPDAAAPATENPNPLFPPPNLVAKGLKALRKNMPHVLTDPLYEHEITPEIVAARAAWGWPLNADWIKRLQDQGKYPRDDSPSPTPPLSPSPPPASNAPTPHSELRNPHSPPPPPGDCSPSNEHSANVESSDPSSVTLNHDAPPAYNNESNNQNDPNSKEATTSQPLLTTSAKMPVTVIQITPNHPTTTCSPTPDSRPPTPTRVESLPQHG